MQLIDVIFINFIPEKVLEAQSSGLRRRASGDRTVSGMAGVVGAIEVGSRPQRVTQATRKKTKAIIADNANMDGDDQIGI